MWDHGMVLGPGLIWGAFLWVLVLAGIGLLVFAAIRATQGSRRPPPPPPAGPPVPPPVGPPPVGSTARQILEERFARGEIDAEEFSERLRVLEGR